MKKPLKQEQYKVYERNGQLFFSFNTEAKVPQNAQKTKKFRSQIGRIENMRYDPQEDVFLCAQDRRLLCRKEQTEMVSGKPVTTEWYRYLCD